MTDVNNHNRYDYQKYCLDNNILGWGWKINNNSDDVQSLQKYKEKYGKSRSLTTAYNQIKDMQDGDYCWAYMNNNWYLGKIKGNFCFNAPDGYPDFGMQHGCEWKVIKDKDLVPGYVTVHYKGTVKYLNVTDDFAKYCQSLYEDTEEKPKNLNFWHLAHYEDLEDIVGLYLQKEKGYFVFPSTNKINTKDYEYMLIQKGIPNKNAVIQCKNNSTVSDDVWKKFESGEEYKDKHIFILTIKKDNHPEKNNYIKSDDDMFKYSSADGRIHVFDENKLKEWARANLEILPKRIKKFLELSE